VSRLDVTDKDPFANASSEENPKDDVGGFGFLSRAVIRYAVFYIFWAVIGYCFYYLVARYLLS
jgi:hypothetical protein|tara:strand:+ start:1202 stop:1390 length:189 start_codon:yes stop_codon:yes gene_type:complete